MKKVVLITGIGGDISQGVATILRESRPDLYLVGIDIHEQHAGTMFVDDFHIVPSANEESYFDTIKNLITKLSIEIVIPMSEPELSVIRNFMTRISNVKWITSGEQVVEIGLDKLKTNQAIEALGLPVPWTIPVKETLPNSYPCIMKSRFGSGSRDIFTISNEEEAIFYAKRYPDAIYQEMLEPANRELTCAVYRKCDGKVFSLLMLRRLTGGFTGWAKIITDDETTKMCERIAHGLDLRGSMNIQLRLTDAGPRVFEINPRFSSTVLMRHRIGYTDVLWALDEAEKKLISFNEVAEGQIITRVQGALVLNNSNNGAGE